MVHEGTTEVWVDGAFRCVFDVWNCVDRIRIIHPDGSSAHSYVGPGSSMSEPDDPDTADALDRAVFHEYAAWAIHRTLALNEGFATPNKESEQG